MPIEAPAQDGAADGLAEGASVAETLLVDEMPLRETVIDIDADTLLDRAAVPLVDIERDGVTVAAPEREKEGERVASVRCTSRSKSAV